jgi:hypothetical protein
MAVKNISIEKGVAYVDSFLYPAMPATQFLGLMQFYENNNPLAVQLASEKLGGDAGEISIESGVGFDVRMEEAETLLLPNDNVTYKFFRIDPTTLNPTELYNGTVTVTGEESGITPLPQPFNNDGNQKIVTSNYTLEYSDHKILLDPPVGTTIEITFPDPAPVRTKQFDFKLRTAGIAELYDKDRNLIATMDTVGDVMYFEATDKAIFEQF